MIRTGTILDMDMTSLGTSLSGGWDWWTDELAQILPDRWQARPQALTGPVAEFGDDGALFAQGTTLDPVAEGEPAAPDACRAAARRGDGNPHCAAASRLARSGADGRD